MTPEQHLDLIAAKCRELLAIAENRTPGKWARQNTADIFTDTEEAKRGVRGHHVADCDPSCDKSVLQARSDAAFIAACAGTAEAGWRATLAAIDRTKRTISRMRSWTDNEAASVAIRCAQEEQQQIRAAWPVEMLTK